MATQETVIRPCVEKMFDEWIEEAAEISLESPPMDLDEDSVRQNAFKFLASICSGVLYWNEHGGNVFVRDLVRHLSYWKQAAHRADLQEVSFANDLLRHWVLQLLLRKETPPRELAAIIHVPQGIGEAGSSWASIASEFVALAKERFKIEW